MPNAIRVITHLSEIEGSPSDIGAEDVNNRGVPNGYATLDSSGNISASHLNVSVDLWDNEL